MHDPPYILHLAVYKPIRHCFDYLLPVGTTIDPHTLQPGIRILVPFGKTHLIGVLLQINQTACIPLDKLRPALAILDTQPIFTPQIEALYQWASQYYQHPIGEVIVGTIPPLLKRPPKIDLKQQRYALTTLGAEIHPDTLKRIPRQAALLSLCKAHPAGISLEAIQTAGFHTAQLRALLEKQWIHPLPSLFTLPLSIKPLPPIKRAAQSPLSLNVEQHAAVTALEQASGFGTFLLEGVTGSGKTEVYLQVIAACLAKGKQALVLVPEIGLTPQTIARFEARFPVHIAALHSGLSQPARRDAWLHAQKGNIRIVIGTRSAIFTPFAHLGVIILDEEHDASFKQHSGFRYSARDIAIMRGRIENVPVLLGTATPSLESVQNVQLGRFKQLVLKTRAGNAQPPSFHLIDLRNKPLIHGLDAQLLTQMQMHLEQNNQVLLFLNRRGYAPVLLCHACGWSASCMRCDAKLTLHHKPLRLICHHCTKTYTMCSTCGQCCSTELVQVGVGTERLEEGLRAYFPTTEMIRIDRDTVPHKNAMENVLHTIYEGRNQILIGTQMLAKGHHFPNVTCVGIVDVDSGLYSTDFRATERMGQLILQVAGRAGRAEKPGQVFLQTHKPDHPLLQVLIQQGYNAFAQLLLEERKTALWPPFSYLVLLRAEAGKEKNALHFLDQARELAKNISDTKKGVQLLGPIPAPMERKAGSFRALLLFQAHTRPLLQDWLAAFVPRLEALPKKSTVRWSLDVDPQEMG